jgi:hypothetical protein
MRRASSPIAAAPSPVEADYSHAAKLVMEGRFEQSVKELAQAKAEAEEKCGIVKTVEQAAGIKAEAEDYARKETMAADARTALANGVQAAAEALRKHVIVREDAVVAQEKSLSARESAVIEAQQKLAIRAKELEGIEAERNEKYAAAVKQLDAKMAEFKSEMTKANAALASRERRLNERLEALKVAAEA